MLTVDDIYNRTGFISVYGFDEETKDEIVENKGTFGLRGRKLYSDCLFLDIDDNDALASEITRSLVGSKVKFDKYHTGGRGWHFHIYIEPMVGADVAYRQKRWVGHHFPGSDLSLYKTSGIIRLPGTYHSNNPGRRKELREQHDGDLLTLTLEDLPVSVGDWCVEENLDTEAILDTLLMKAASAGGRNNAIYQRAMLMSKLDIEEDKALRILSKYNSMLVSPPVGDNELVNTINSAYRG